MEGMTFSQGYHLWDGYDVQRWVEETLGAEGTLGASFCKD